MRSKLIFYWFIGLILCCDGTYAQDSIRNISSIQKPSVLSAHVFGIFISRLEGNFKDIQNNKFSLQFDYLSANIWGQPVENYIPTTPELKNRISQFPWHTREFQVSREDESFIEQTDDFSIAYDGVIKGFKAKVDIPLNKKNALHLEWRSFILTEGRFPFTGITGDDFIEGIHSNIAGGEDPFQRREFGLNQAGIIYKDRNDNLLKVNQNEFFLGGLKSSLYHYFNFENKWDINFNLGIHPGLNLSSYNQSLDLGFTVNTHKNLKINETKYVQIGLSLGYLNLNTVSFSNNNINFAEKSHFLNLETALTFNLVNSKNNTHTFGIDFYIQSAYYDPKEYDYSILFRNDKALRSWHHSVSHLYKNNNYWTFFYAFTKKNSFRIYLQQDWLVNNNPDLQTGVEYLIFLDELTFLWF